MNGSVADQSNPTPEIELTEERLNAAADAAIAAFEAAADLAALEEAKRAHLGEQSPIMQARKLSLIHISEPTRREWLSRMPSSA